MFFKVEANAPSLFPTVETNITTAPKQTSEFLNDSEANFFTLNDVATPTPSKQTNISSSNNSSNVKTTASADLGLLMGDLDLNQNTTNTKKIDKDSILALYAKGSTTANNSIANLTNVPSGNFVQQQTNNMFNTNMSNSNLLSKMMSNSGNMAAPQQTQSSQFNFFLGQAQQTQKPNSNALLIGDNFVILHFD